MIAGIFRGKVLSVSDSSQLGRIKVEVYPHLVGKETARTLSAQENSMKVEGIDTDLMPWAVPAFSLFDGSGSGTGCFCVPKVGSYVFVFFENGDIYQPIYFAEAADTVHGLPTERTTNYPSRKVWKTSGGFIIYLDDTSGSEKLNITHPSGTTVTIESDGSVKITSVADTTVETEGSIILTAGENIDITAQGNVKIVGTEVNINEKERNSTVRRSYNRLLFFL
jgi:hypothetical protein